MYVDAGATYQGNAVAVNSSNVNTSFVGIYTVTYQATSTGGATLTASRTVTVIYEDRSESYKLLNSNAPNQWVTSTNAITTSEEVVGRTGISSDGSILAFCAGKWFTQAPDPQFFGNPATPGTISYEYAQGRIRPEITVKDLHSGTTTIVPMPYVAGDSGEVRTIALSMRETAYLVVSDPVYGSATENYYGRVLVYHRTNGQFEWTLVYDSSESSYNGKIPFAGIGRMATVSDTHDSSGRITVAYNHMRPNSEGSLCIVKVSQSQGATLYKMEIDGDVNGASLSADGTEVVYRRQPNSGSEFIVLDVSNASNPVYMSRLVHAHPALRHVTVDGGGFGAPYTLYRKFTAADGSTVRRIAFTDMTMEQTVVLKSVGDTVSYQVGPMSAAGSPSALLAGADFGGTTGLVDGEVLTPEKQAELADNLAASPLAEWYGTLDKVVPSGVLLKTSSRFELERVFAGVPGTDLGTAYISADVQMDRLLIASYDQQQAGASGDTQHGGFRIVDVNLGRIESSYVVPSTEEEIKLGLGGVVFERDSKPYAIIGAGVSGAQVEMLPGSD